MAEISYPANLPAPLAGHFEEDVLETKVQDQGEVGAPRLRNRFTRLLERFSYSLILEKADKAAILAFYDTTLVRGVKSFNWTHPTTGRVYEAIMRVRPKVSHIEADLWSVDVAVDEI